MAREARVKGEGDLRSFATSTDFAEMGFGMLSSSGSAISSRSYVITNLREPEG
jgi:hypothetical protein